MNKSLHYNKKVREYFDESSDTYDLRHSRYNTTFGYIEKMRKECVMSMVGRKNDERILDAGCGTGYYLKALSGNDVFGIDISKEMIKQCNDKNLPNLIVASNEFLPFKYNTFNLIICINAFHYTILPQKILNEMREVLREDGDIILTVLNWTSPRGIFHLFRRVFRKQKNLEGRYTIFGLQRMFGKDKLKIADITGFNFILTKSDCKRRNGRVLNMFEEVERIVRRTPIKYFCNEFVIRLVKEKI